MPAQVADHRSIVVIGASAGGVEALTKLVAGLPPDLDAAVFIALHLSPWSPSTLPSILNRSGVLPAAQAADAEPIRTGRIYVAPPDRHLLLSPGRINVTRGPRENGHRPAIDAMFRTAAASYGPGVVGVILSGTLDDGALGVRTIKERGGVAIIQSDALYPDMPRTAAEAADVDHVAPIDQIPDLICASVLERPPELDTFEPQRIRLADAPYQAPLEPGPATEVTCPACGGVLTQVSNDPQHFRCRVGHAYGNESLLAHQNDALERSLWAALRALEERADLLDRIASRFEHRGSSAQADRFKEDMRVVRERADIVRRALLDRELIERDGPLASSDVNQG
jgi:two-component system, chemotaxis family, protein-glutamate methylesterase/glutaminase